MNDKGLHFCYRAFYGVKSSIVVRVVYLYSLILAGKLIIYLFTDLFTVHEL